MNNLIEQIRSAQIAAGEAAVLRSLEASGLAPEKPLQVLAVTHGGTTLYVELTDVAGLRDAVEALGGSSCTLDLKTMARAEFEALGDFNGF